MKKDMIEVFEKIYGSKEGVKIFFAPGRVNLIGEHIDYNGGYVLPCALNIGTFMAIRLREDDLVCMYSMNFKEDNMIQYPLSKGYVLAKNWTKYATGVLSELSKAGYPITKGFEMVVSGHIPNGAGLSSSASLEMVMARAINTLYDFNLRQIDLVKLAQKAENDFVGLNCGIMDQFIIGMGKENYALLLNTDTMTYDHIALDLRDYTFLITNTNHQRGLADSKYNERREECQKALEIIRKSKDVSTLCDLNIQEFDEVKNTIKDPILLRRARHVIYENNRTIRGAKYLASGSLTKFGEVMNQSHESLKDDYEVSCKALDVLVSLSRNIEGVLGSRMTGAGFGGCTVTLIKKECIPAFIESVGKSYEERVGLKADFYEVTIGDGAREVIYNG